MGRFNTKVVEYFDDVIRQKFKCVTLVGILVELELRQPVPPKVNHQDVIFLLEIPYLAEPDGR